jgi:hypothetical protein
LQNLMRRHTGLGAQVRRAPDVRVAETFAPGA